MTIASFVQEAEKSMEFSPQEVLPGMSERELLEGMKPAELLDYKAFLLERYSDLERQVHLVNDVLDGYGVEEIPDIIA